MQKSDIVIVGGVATGPKCAAALIRRRPEMKVTLYQREKELSYATCGMPFFASGDVNSFEELARTPFGVPRDVDFFRTSKGFEAVCGAEVMAIDRRAKTVRVRMIESDETFEHAYGKLVLATGAVPVAPPFPVPESPLVRSFTRPDDARQFRLRAQQGELEKVLIVGGGFIGCEVAEAVADMWGLAATLIEKEDRLLPGVLDPEMAAIVQREMERHDIDVRTGTTVERIELDADGKPVVHLSDGSSSATDMVFLGLGVRPNTVLAEKAGLEIGRTGAIAVGATLQTSDPDIYAGGDCVESDNLLTGGKCHLPMGSLANRHGRLIAENLADSQVEFPAVLGAVVLRVFERNVAAVGLTPEAAEAAGYRAETVWGSFVDKPDYFPESKTMTLKMVYDGASGRLLGLQAVGSGDVCRRADVFSTFLARQGVVDDLLGFEHVYAPPFSEAMDPLAHMAAIVNARRRGLRFLGPGEKPPTDRLPVWLDVREADEAAERPLTNATGGEVLTLPLGDLCSHLEKLDRERPIVIVCQRGARSYQAASLLAARGFTDTYIVAGGLQALS
jgi:NADPH-dependent 2,4-dienoyl-CoA reductase/sulfur reductase-like enzyme/rhodanese-related sulfurtransferase